MLEIEVFGDWLQLGGLTPIGMLRCESSRGTEVFSFEYHPEWLQSDHALELDPDLRLFSGLQYPPAAKESFGLFLDSSPDRWGRTLMKRREAMRARQESRPVRRLLASDFLLGVDDSTRMGALRFRLAGTDRFLAHETALRTPPISSIRELEQATVALESDSDFHDGAFGRWMELLVAPGSSLGGARPKANVVDPDGGLWVAKFPSKSDDRDSGAWECVVHQMAGTLDIRIPAIQARRFSQRHHSFLSRRFDRTASGRRLHFASAMTLLGHQDGHDHTAGGSYLELVEFMEQYGAAPNEDIRELWRRVVFSAAVSNTDDHLRNHGFLLTPQGWRLAPVYDINPNEDGTGLHLNISDQDNSLDFDLCLDVSPFYRYGKKEAEAFLQRCRQEVQQWATRADAFGISKMEKELVGPAFDRAARH